MAVLMMAACKETPKQMADRVFALAEEQFELLDSQLQPGEFPRTIGRRGELSKSDLGWWCSGFFPGSLWYVYEYTGNESMKEKAEKYTKVLEGLTDRDTDHDIGFQINSSYGNAYRITGDESYLPMLDLAAHRLAGRFNEAVGCTRSWGGAGNSEPIFRVIIDNMMNLEVMMDVAERTGADSLKQVAMVHANTTMKNHFRDDFSTWHLVVYNPEDGSIMRKQTVQGFSDDSMWARGEAWALYGYTMMYRKSGEKSYLTQAENIADIILRRLPEDGIPFWDFDCPDIPDTKRDASAAAIMSSAFLQLYQITKDKKYLETADKQLRMLASPEYLYEKGDGFGFLVKHCVGSLPGHSEVDVPLTYADYYFLEALQMYAKM